MSQENVEVVRRNYAALVAGFETGSLTSPSHALDPRVSANTPASCSRQSRTTGWSPEEFVDAGDDQVLVFSREGGRGRGSGVEVTTQPTAHLWTLREGKAIRMQSHWERDDALQAAGLSE